MMRSVAIFTALVLAACASAPPQADKVQTEAQAVQLAKATCDVRGAKGKWRARWEAGRWTVNFDAEPQGWPLELTIISASGQTGECRWAEY